MRDIFIVMKFTMKEMLTRKSLIITTVLLLALIVVGFNIPNLLKISNSDPINANTILVYDPETVLDHQVDLLNSDDPNSYHFEETNLTNDELKHAIEDGTAATAVVISKSSPNNYNLKFLVQNPILDAEIVANVSALFKQSYPLLKISSLGLSEAEIATLYPTFNTTMEQINGEEVSGNTTIMMILCMILFFAIFYCAIQVSTSVTTEKTSKIIETLVTSTSPTSIIIGKTLGIGLVGLLQIALLVITAIISAFTFLGDAIISKFIDLSSFTPLLALIAALCFLLGYFIYALLYALTGATVSKPEDVQSANTIPSLVAMFGFYLAYFTILNPTSNLSIFAALFPFSSPFSIPVRMVMGIATPLEIVLGLLFLIIAIALIARIAIKIYSNAILNYGSKISWRKLLK